MAAPPIRARLAAHPAAHLGAAAALVAAALAGCYRPAGPLMNYTGAPVTLISSEMQQKRVEIVDLRTDEVVFSMDIPAGKQLVFDFVAGKGDDPVQSPDLMRYQVFDAGTTTGKLLSMMSVPNAPSRRIDINIITGPEFAAAAPERQYRTDELADRPDWWTPAGGALPDDPRGVRMYDD